MAKIGVRGERAFFYIFKRDSLSSGDSTGAEGDRVIKGLPGNLLPIF